jgi:CO/xanthine dehydrogenase Mo-binding subunit
VVNAVADALGVDEIQVPLTAQKIWAALQS